MKILKLNFIILGLFIVKTECGVIDNVLGTVKSTAEGLRADVHNMISYGNDLVFGEKEKNVENTNNDCCVTEAPKTKGLITNLIHKSVDKVSDLRHILRRTFIKSDNDQPHKGIITRVCESINNKLKSIQEHFDPIVEPIQISEKPISDDYGKFLDRDSKEFKDHVVGTIYNNNMKVFNELNITEADILKIFEDVKGKVKEEVVLPTKAEVNADVNLDIDIRSLADTEENKQ